MTKDEWYENRILWRAKQHGLPNDRDVLSAESAETPLVAIQGRADFDGIPVLVFFESSDTWTLLTSRQVISFHGGRLFSGNLDDINKAVSLWETECTFDKTTESYLFLKNLGFAVWAPKGKPLYALWSILNMFPLRKEAMQ